MTTNEIASLAHMLNMEMNRGLTPAQIKNAERKWAELEILALARTFEVSDEVAQRMTYRVWHSLRVIDHNRKMAGLTEFYRKGVS